MRNVRPSWVAVDVEGHASPLAGGPVSRTGDLRAVFSARVDGTSVPILAVSAIPSDDGRIVTWTVRDRRTGRTLFAEEFEQ